MAKAILWPAVEVARGQKSTSLELRAARCLARLLRQQKRAAEGGDVLAECYAWSTEGFGTADLREATGFPRELRGKA